LLLTRTCKSKPPTAAILFYCTGFSLVQLVVESRFDFLLYPAWGVGGVYFELQSGKECNYIMNMVSAFPAVRWCVQ